MKLLPVPTIGKVLSGENLIPKAAITELPKSMVEFKTTVDKFAKAQVSKPNRFAPRASVNRGK